MTRKESSSGGQSGHIGDPLRLPYARILQEVQRVRVSDAYRRMVTMAAALYAGQVKLFRDAAHGLDDQDFATIDRAYSQLLLDMEARPFQDILGPVYMEIAHKLDKSARGEFFTPHSLSRLLSRLAIGGDPRAMFKPGEILECNEPAAGTAGMVLAFAEELTNNGISPFHTRWVVQDINPLSCYGAFLNTLLWGIPAVVVCGDTIRMTQDWAWPNIHWHAAHPLIPTPEQEARERGMYQRINAMREFIAGLPESISCSGQEAI